MLAIALCPHPRQDIHSHGGRDISPRCLPSPCAPHPRSTFRLSTIERSDRLKCRGDACHRPVPLILARTYTHTEVEIYLRDACHRPVPSSSPKLRLSTIERS